VFDRLDPRRDAVELRELSDIDAVDGEAESRGRDRWFIGTHCWGPFGWLDLVGLERSRSGSLLEPGAAVELTDAEHHELRRLHRRDPDLDRQDAGGTGLRRGVLSG